MYEVKIKSKRVKILPRSELYGEEGYNEVQCEPFDIVYSVHVVLPYDTDTYIDSRYCLNTVFIYDQYIQLYDSIDYYCVDLHFDPNKYYIELDYDDVLNILLVVIKEKGEIYVQEG